MRSHGTDVDTEKDGAPKTRRKPGRVPTSCAECRRLKLRCDKDVPCQKCVSRGCGSICPNGTLTPGKGNRLILANTEELHDRIDALCSRIRDLETALRIAHQSVSDQPHPLLQKDVLQPLFPHNVNPPVASTPTAANNPSSAVPTLPERPPDHQPQLPEVDGENFVDAFGTLVLGTDGQNVYHGRTARSEHLIRVLVQQHPRTFQASSRLSKQMIDASTETTLSESSFVREAFSILPPLSQAVHLCEVYQEYGKSMYTSVPRTALLDEIMTPIYRVDSYETFTDFDSLALLFSIFALGAHFDPDQQSYSVESQEFYHIARGVLRRSPRPTQMSIQAQIHVAQYLEFSDWESVDSKDTWMYIGHAVRLAQSAGLDLNGARWNLSESNVQRHSRLFWQLFHLDTWASFHLGRQPAMSTPYIDWPLPQEADCSITGRDSLSTFDAWNWRFSTLLHRVMANAFVHKQPSYTSVLSMDRQIRDFPVHPTWRPVSDGPRPPVELSAQRWIILSSKEATLLNLHRPYFVRALQEMPNHIVQHRYLPSVMSVYRSAWRLMRGLKMVWGQAAHVLSRTSLSWSQGLSATVMMCLLITRVPTSNLARLALTELDNVLDLFKTASSVARPAANLLDSIRCLHKKAHDVLNRATEGIEDVLPDTELDRWAGKTYLISKVGSPHSNRSEPSQSGTTHTAIGAEYRSYAQVDNMHPTLVQAMRDFDTCSPSFEWFFDFPSTEASQTHGVPQRPMPEVQMNDFYNTSTADYGFQAQVHHSPFLQIAPILDATWQTFAEQLGF